MPGIKVTGNFKGQSSPSVRFSITGFPAIERKLASLPVKVQNGIVRKALRQAARPVLATARARVPSPGTYGGGALKASLKIRALSALPNLKSRSRSRNKVGISVCTNPTGHAFKGDQFYGGFVEWGAPLHTFFGRSVQPMKAQPFMRPARDENRGRVRAIFLGVVAKLIAGAAR